MNVVPSRVTAPRTWSPSRSSVMSPIFFGSPNVSRPPITDCSVLIGITSA
jgi:hypothetical protein